MGVRDIHRGTTQLTLRIGSSVLWRAKRLMGHVALRLGMPATRTDVLREALLRGLEILERSDDDAESASRKSPGR
ncbi:MAG: hypothetical protein ACREJ3_05610 [Polyangiaceae bacterium]